MFAIIETIAYLVFWVCVAAFAFAACLYVIDLVSSVVIFVYVKLFIDKEISYVTFRNSWNDMKRRV